MRRDMKELIAQLQEHMKLVAEIGNDIEDGKEYMGSLKSYLPYLNEIIKDIFGLIQDSKVSLELSPEFVMQVLNDIIYGIKQEDSVFLLDVLRYGLLEIYAYIETELQSGGVYEQGQ